MWLPLVVGMHQHFGGVYIGPLDLGRWAADPTTTFVRRALEKYRGGESPGDESLRFLNEDGHHISFVPLGVGCMGGKVCETKGSAETSQTQLL